MSGIKWTKSVIRVGRQQVPVLYIIKSSSSDSRELIELRNKEMLLLGTIERGKDAGNSREDIETDIHIFLQGCLNNSFRLLA